MNQAWKEGRGIWHDRTNNLLILINEEEHIKIIYHQSGDDLFHVFEKLGDLLLEIENLLMWDGYEFMRNGNYGYLASRLQELGTSLRISVNVNLPLIAKVGERLISRNYSMTRREGVGHLNAIFAPGARIYQLKIQIV